MRALSTTAVLEDASSFLDDRSAIFRAAVEHGRQLTLTHDDVLLATHPGVAEQLLNIEQPTRHTVDGVLAVTGPEQGSHDGDLGEADGQHPGVVVDGERNLGTAQRRALGGTGEDDVFHLVGADGFAGLGPQYPGHGVHDVGLARSIGPHHHRDPRLEIEGGGVGEGLEAFEREGLEEHCREC